MWCNYLKAIRERINRFDGDFEGELARVAVLRSGLGVDAELEYAGEELDGEGVDGGHAVDVGEADGERHGGGGGEEGG